MWRQCLCCSPRLCLNPIERRKININRPRNRNGEIRLAEIRNPTWDEPLSRIRPISRATPAHGFAVTKICRLPSSVALWRVIPSSAVCLRLGKCS
jgi:hypothetical protein